MSASAQIISAEEGSQTITTVVGDRIDITGGQTSVDHSNLFQGFEQFDLETQQTANFVTTPNIQNVVGRINSANASTINGTLQVSGSDANLYLMNPAGILIGPEAQLNLPGSFTATTATGIGFGENTFFSASNEDYSTLSGELTTFQFQAEQPGAIVNVGDLTVQQGEAINFIGGTVVNAGTLSAPEGSITLAAVEGNNIVRFQQGQQLLSFEVKSDNTSLNNQTLHPTSIGEMLTGGNLSGVTELVTNSDGSVQLKGQQDSIAEDGGSAIASGVLSTVGEVGGNINVLGDRVTLNNASLDTSGNYQGGLIRVGGDYKGNGPVYNASQTNIDLTSTLNADALDSGDGGRVIVWSDEITSFLGQINAQGGLEGGNGGFAEVSGKRQLAFNGSADLRALQGEIGTLLLDPENWTITKSLFAPPDTATDSYISAASLSLQSLGSDISLEATNDITVEDLDFLIFAPGRAINFTADSDGDGLGAFTMQDLNTQLIVEQGEVTISGAGITVGEIDTSTQGNLLDTGFNRIDDDVQGGNVTLTSSQGVIVNSINTGVVLDSSTVVNLDRETYSDDGGDVTIRANNGDITINDLSLTSFISPLDFAGDGGIINLQASGTIQTGGLQTTSVTEANNAGRAGDIIINSLSGNVLVSGTINTQSVAINNAGNGGSINIEANNGSITTRTISTVSEAELDPADNGGRNSGQGGTILLTALDNITTESLKTFSQAETNASQAGDITLTTSNGSISAQNIEAYSNAVTGISGAGGDISLTALGNIDSSDVRAFSQAQSDAGLGGDITLTTSNGSISARDIATISNSTTGTSGAGGDISLTAFGNINGLNVRTFSQAETNASQAGDITLTTSNGNISAQNIEAYSNAVTGISDAGGDISLTAFGSINGLNVRTFSQAETNASQAGNITLATSNGNISAQDIVTISNSITGTSDAGGDIFLTAFGDINSSNVLSYSFANNDTGNGGSVFIESQNGNIGASEIDSESTAISNTSGNGGNVELIANSNINISNNVTTASLSGGNISGQGGTIQISGNEVDVDNLRSLSSASSDAGDAGLIDVTGQNLIRINNGIDASSIGGGNRADIELTGNGIALNGGDNTIIGNTVLLDPYSINQNIHIGSTSFSAGLDLLGNDLNAIDTRVSNILIGHTDGTGIVKLHPGALLSTGNTRAPIEILGGGSLNGPDVATSLHLTGSGEGFLQSEDLSFSNIDNLVGGNNDDIYLPDLGVSLEDFNSIDGGGGFNQITYSEWLGTPVTLDLGEITLNNTQNIIGPGNGSTLIGNGGGQSWIIDGSDSGSVSGQAFETFDNLAGGLGDDTFSFLNTGSLSGDIDGADGQDSLDYAAFNGPINIDLANNSATALTSFNNIENFIGSSDNNDILLGTNNNDNFELTSNSGGNVNSIFSSLFIFNDIEVLDGQGGDNTLSIQNLVPATNSSWTIDGNNTGFVNSIDFNNFSNLVGNALDDTFNFTNSGNLTGAIDGMGGNNAIDYSAFSSPVSVDLEANTASGLTGFNSIGAFIGSANDDSLRGTNNDETFFIDGPNSGNIDGNIDFNSFESLDGQGGINSLDFSAYTAPIDVNLATSSATDVSAFSNFENFIGGNSNNDVISGSNTDDLFQLTTDDSGSINGTIDFSSFEGFDGQGGQNTLSLDTLTTILPNSFNIDGNNSGSINGQDFNNFANLIGSTQNNIFKFINNGNLTGDIDGANGQDSFDYSAFNGPINISLTTNTTSGVNSFNSIENFTGSSSNNDILLGSNNDETFELTSATSGNIDGAISFDDIEILDGQGGNNTFSIENLTPATNSNWIIDGNNSGSVNSIDFNNFASLVGNALDDTFNFTNSGNLTGAIDGMGGSNALDYSAFSSLVSVDLENNSASGLAAFNSIDNFIGSANVDTLLSTNADDTFVISGPNVGVINGSINFNSFEALDAQVGQDTLDFSSYTSPVSVNLETGTATDISAFSNFESFVGGGSNNDVISGSNGDDIFQLTTDNSGSINSSINFNSFEGFDGQGGQNTLSLDTLTTTSPNSFDIDGNNSGSINGQGFNNFTNLTGSSQNDRFNFINSGNLSGTIEGAGGQDALDYSNFTGPISIDLATNSASGINSFNSLENFTGSTSNNDALLGSNADETFELTSTNSGNIAGTLTFNDIEVLDGQGGTNTFSIQNLTPSTASNWSIDGSNSGSLNGIGFINFANLTGNAEDDTFSFINNGSLTGDIDGAGGGNTLDYSNFTSPVTVDLATNSSSGLDSFIGIETLIGSSNDDTLKGTNNDETFFINGPNAGSIDGNIDFSSFESLDGQGGRNSLDFSAYTAPMEVNLATSSATDVSAFSNFENFVGGSSTNDIILGSNSDDLFQLSTNDSGTINGVIDFSSFEGFDGQGGQNTLSLETLTTTSPNSFDIDGTNRGSINGQAFNNFANLTGNALDDSFNFINNGNLNGTIDGADGQDSLNYSAFNGPISIDLATNSASGLNSFNSIENFTGSAHPADDYIRGSLGDDTFEVTGDRSGTITTPSTTLSFSEIETLDGGNGENTFRLNSSIPNTNLTIAGGSNLFESNNRIITGYTDTTWQLDTINQGRILKNGATVASFRDIQHLENASTTAGEQRVEFTAANSQITDSLDGGTSNLTLVGNDINIGHAVNGNDIRNGRISGSGILTIKPTDNNVGIELGGFDSQDPNTVSITGGELAAIQDGFTNILIGGPEQTGSITLGGDAEVRDPLTLQSQGNIDTTGGELRGGTTDANINIIADGSINAGNITTLGSDISLTAQQDISVESLSTTGDVNGQGILLNSSNGGINVATNIESNGNEVGNDINITAQTEVNIEGDIVTSGGDRSGDLTLTTTSGALSTGNIITANGNLSGSTRGAGSVTLESANDIQVGFIDARGNGNNTEDTTINITTPTNFRAQAAFAEIDVSLSTTGAQNGSITLEYGDPTIDASAFTVQKNSNNGTAGSIATSLSELASGEFIGSYTQENISLISRGIPPVDPPVEPPVDPPVDPPTEPPIESSDGETTPITGALLTKTETLSTAGSGEGSLLLPNTINSTEAEQQELENVFEALETSHGEAFGSYLSPSSNQIKTPVRTLHEVQEKLREIDQFTEAQPALVYVYFVSVSSSVESFEASQSGSTTPNQDAINNDSLTRSNQPDDQLEVMLITADNEPQRFRRWGITRDQVEQTTQNLRAQVTRQFSTARQYLPPAQQLYDWIVSPIQDQLEAENINSLGFVMDSGLRTLPIATLHDGDQYLIEDYSLGLLPTASLTNFDNTHISRDTFETAQVLAMGASEFTDQPALPAVEVEVNVITDILLEGDAFLNEEFVRDNLQNQLQKKDYEILHLATHASFESGNLDESYIQLWDEKLSLNNIQELGLDQHMLDLIILSACNTALGDPASEYGFAGFAVNSGATTAVASVWPVSDEGTLGFMNEFYRELHGTALRSEALRKAQLTLMRGDVGIRNGTVYGPDSEIITHIPELLENGQWDFSHPFYWSAFTAIGNPW
ncbi:MAG: CHAT domain-containing protein [Cyanobacteria bacterium P01_F01_bin.53]